MAARVPRYLHLPMQIMWFDVEDIVLIILCYTLWLVIGNGWTLPLVVLVPYWFITVKADMPRGYLQHLMYSYGFISMEAYPSPQSVEFAE